VQQKRLGRAERDTGDRAHCRHIAEAGAIASDRSAGKKADAQGSGCRSDPGPRVAKIAAGDEPLAGADDRSCRQAAQKRRAGAVDSAGQSVGADSRYRERNEAGRP
jgi:hypothetical protein